MKFKELFEQSLIEKVNINTNKYFASHNKLPKGFGDWAFFFSMSDYKDNKNVEFIKGSFADAKKKAIEMAKKKNSTELIVGP